MEIICTDIAKKFRKEILFSDFNYTFQDQQNYAILGPNSSGKSTMLKIIGGFLEPSKGEITVVAENNPIAAEHLYDYFSYTSPEMHLFSEFTVEDAIHFHFQLKEAKGGLSEFIDFSELKPFLNKSYNELSSGLKNKLKLALSIFSKAPCLLLDEPCTNFDTKNIEWYRGAIDTYCEDQMIIVASNQLAEYSFCKNLIELNHFKK